MNLKNIRLWQSSVSTTTLFGRVSAIGAKRQDVLQHARFSLCGMLCAARKLPARINGQSSARWHTSFCLLTYWTPNDFRLSAGLMKWLLSPYLSRRCRSTSPPKWKVVPMPSSTNGSPNTPNTK